MCVSSLQIAQKAHKKIQEEVEETLEQIRNRKKYQNWKSDWQLVDSSCAEFFWSGSFV